MRQLKKDSQYSALSLLLLKGTGSLSLAKSVWHKCLEAEENIILEKDLSQPYDRFLRNGERRDIPLNPLWWELADSGLKSELTCICGCAHHY